MSKKDDIETWNAEDPAWMARSGAIPEIDHGDFGEGWLFPDGSRSIECTNWAVYVRRAYGARAKIYGFYVDDNPEAKGLAQLADGHDFAVLDDRYIIDGWIVNVGGELSDPIVDLEDPSQAQIVISYYGDRDQWMRMSDLEAKIDAEDVAIFEMSMQNVMPVSGPSAPSM